MIKISQIKKDIKLSLDYGVDNPNNKTLHIRSIIDDDYVVFKWWSRTKQRWIYQVEHKMYFEVNNDVMFIKN